MAHVSLIAARTCSIRPLFRKALKQFFIGFIFIVLSAGYESSINLNRFKVGDTWARNLRKFGSKFLVMC